MPLLSDKLRHLPKQDKRAIAGQCLRPTRRSAKSRPSSMYEAAAWDENKNEQRRIVFDVVKATIVRKRQIRALTLPGERWAFEHAIAERWKKCRFIGFESCRATFERSWAHMPFDGKCLTQHSWHSRLGYTDVACRGHGTRSSVLFNANVVALFRNALYPDHWEQTKTWSTYSRNFNLIWIDSTSPLGCENTIAILRNLRYVLPLTHRDHVFALTFILGRDDNQLSKVFRLVSGSALERRVKFLEEYLPRYGVNFEPVATYVHESANNSSFLKLGTVVGTCMRNQ